MTTSESFSRLRLLDLPHERDELRLLCRQPRGLAPELVEAGLLGIVFFDRPEVDRTHRLELLGERRDLALQLVEGDRLLVGFGLGELAERFLELGELRLGLGQTGLLLDDQPLAGRPVRLHLAELARDLETLGFEDPLLVGEGLLGVTLLRLDGLEGVEGRSGPPSLRPGSS